MLANCKLTFLIRRTTADRIMLIGMTPLFFKEQIHVL
jgi:hypothetical protein